MLAISPYWIYIFLSAANIGIIQCSKNVRTVRRGSGSDSQCMSSLIKSRDEFPDSAFSASSTLEDRVEFQPYQARLTEVYGSKEHTSGHAWCPGTPIEESLREWIQAEFTGLVVIGAIFTAGRGDGNVKEFMPNFVLKYQREDNGPWYEHVKQDGTRVLKANSDPRNLARATLDSMIIAKRIRIYPYSRDGKQQVCLRFALFGCKFPDGVVSYSMPQGGDRSYSSNPAVLGNPIGTSSANFRDLSYDGQMIGTNDHLTEGMGQLMDNVAYLGNVTNTLALHPSQPGFHFVGWYQHGQTEVPIIFKFDTARSFTWVRLFTFDSIQLRARLFSRVVVAFSLDGQAYNHSVEVFTGRAQLFDPRTAAFARTRRAGDGVDRFAKQTHVIQSQRDPLIYVDHDWDGALVLEADLGGRVGRFVRLSLTATDGWILLSEVQFNSTIVEPSASSTTFVSSGAGTELRAPVRDVAFSGLDHPGQNRGPLDPTNQSPLVADKSRSDDAPVVSDGHRTPSKSASSSSSSSSSSAVGDPNGNGALHLSRGPFMNPLPFIIAAAVLLPVIVAIFLIYLCTRQHQKRSQVRLHRKSLIGSDSTKPGFHSAPMTGTGGIHHVPGLLDVPGVFGTAAVHEATKLLNNPPYPGVPANLRVDGLTNVTATNNVGQVPRLANGTHLNEAPTVMNGPVNLGLSFPTRNGPGVILPCSPSSSCSSHANAVESMPTTVGCGLTSVSTIASPVQPPPLPPNTTMEMQNIYAGTDLSCMSPEYASASLFGFTPPPSETPCSHAPPTCTESMPATHYRPSIPNYTVSFARPGQGLVSGTGTLYAGPASLPVTAATLRRPQPGQHGTPNATHQFQSTQTAGILFLPHSALTNPHAEEAATGAAAPTGAGGGSGGGGGGPGGGGSGMYQATLDGFSATDFGAPYNICQPVQPGPTDELAQQRGDNQRTVLTKPQETWVFSSHPDDISSRMGPTGSSALFSRGQFHFVPANGLLDLSHSYSPNVSPQHYYPGPLIFPSVPPLSNRPLMDASAYPLSPMDQQQLSRGSPVGAHTSVAMGITNRSSNYVQPSSDTTNRDGANSNRLSIYSLCS